MRAGLPLSVFGVLCAAALLPACGGGGGSGPAGQAVVPAATPTPVPASAAGLVDGASASYDERVDTTVSYTSVGFGSGVTVVPSPAPTTTTLTSTYGDAVTVAANRSFAGTSGLYDLHVARTPTGATAAGYGAYVQAEDDYDALIAGAGGTAELVSYGAHDTSAVTFTGLDATTENWTRTNTVPLSLRRLPAAGQSYDAVVAYASTLAGTESNLDPTSTPVYVPFGPTSSTSSGTVTLRADGSFAQNQSLTFNDGSSSTRADTVTGPGLGGTRTDVATDANGNKQTATVTVGAPVGSGAGATIPYAAQVTGGTPFAASVPLWYPAGATQRVETVHVADLGAQSAPASCALGAGFPASAEATRTTDTQVDGFAGIVSTVDTTSWDAAGYGTLCSIATESYAEYDPRTGAKLDGGSSTVTRALRSVALPAGRSRASLSPAALPVVLAPPRPRLPRLVAALKRRAANAARRASFGPPTVR